MAEISASTIATCARNLWSTRPRQTCLRSRKRKLRTVFRSRRSSSSLQINCPRWTKSATISKVSSPSEIRKTRAPRKSSRRKAQKSLHFSESNNKATPTEAKRSMEKSQKKKNLRQAKFNKMKKSRRRKKRFPKKRSQRRPSKKHTQRSRPSNRTNLQRLSKRKKSLQCNSNQRLPQHPCKWQLPVLAPASLTWQDSFKKTLETLRGPLPTLKTTRNLSKQMLPRKRNLQNKTSLQQSLPKKLRN